MPIEAIAKKLTMGSGSGGCLFFKNALLFPIPNTLSVSKNTVNAMKYYV